MNYLVTLNVNDWIPANVAESHADAARRWDARYIQIENAPPEGMYAAKSQLWLMRFKREDQIFWIDGDAIIREDCPNLLQLVGPKHLAVVGAIQTGNPPTEKTREYFSILDKNSPGNGVEWSHYFNSGVFVIPGAYMWVMRAAWGMAESYRQMMGEAEMGSGIEESSMNLAAYGLLPWWAVRRIPDAYNRIGPSAWAGKWVEKGGSQNYILHLANGPWADGDKRERLAAIDWRVAVGAAP